jgi:hypothetical protein
MGKKTRINIASGDDRVAAQIGHVSAGGKGERKRSGGKEAGRSRSGRTVNVVAGNARVGVQTDRLDGDITITF